MIEILYHASLNKNLIQLESQATLSKDAYIGDYVFATENRLYALMYLAPNAAGTKLMETRGKPYIVINGTRERFDELDEGGAIYAVPAGPFTRSPQAGLEDMEMVSTKAVTPLSKEVFDSSLAAIKGAGITVYFLRDGDFERVLYAGGNSRSVLADFTIDY